MNDPTQFFVDNHNERFEGKEGWESVTQRVPTWCMEVCERVPGSGTLQPRLDSEDRGSARPASRGWA